MFLDSTAFHGTCSFKFLDSTTQAPGRIMFLDSTAFHRTCSFRFLDTTTQVQSWIMFLDSTTIHGTRVMFLDSTTPQRRTSIIATEKKQLFIQIKCRKNLPFVNLNIETNENDQSCSHEKMTRYQHFHFITQQLIAKKNFGNLLSSCPRQEFAQSPRVSRIWSRLSRSSARSHTDPPGSLDSASFLNLSPSCSVT